jgi:signal transduction histidine kinase
VITRDGRTIWVRDEAVLVYDDAGEPRYWQGLSFNITDRTMAELEATRRLAALDELSNSMLTAISHELRTPLAGILGASVRASLGRAPCQPASSQLTRHLQGRG